MYCRHCGDELKSANAIFCTSCNTRVGEGNNFCNECGETNNSSTESNCLKCGAFLNPVEDEYDDEILETEENSIDSDESFKLDRNKDESSELKGMPKKKKIAILLALFLGSFGVHRFYIGQKETAIAMVLTAVVAYITSFDFIYTILGLWIIVDMFLIGFSVLKPANGYYI